MRKVKSQLGKRLTAAMLTAAVVVGTLCSSMTGEAERVNAKGALTQYSVEGYASAKQVTGGGILKETDEQYYKVSTAEGFLKALASAKKAKKAAVIEITEDIALGSKEIGSALTTYKTVVEAANNQPLLHPTLLKTGVSMINIKEMEGLTIFSKNGAKITHACFNISRSKNIIIRNLVFDEIWEWDENTKGNYDRNDWDYITAQNGVTALWVDHCTFYKAYDGIIDVKKAAAAETSDVTISYSKFLPGSEGEFFDAMMRILEANPAKYPYYNSLRSTYGMTKEQVRGYAYGQKKTHLIGASDSEANTKNLRVTLANNYYKDSMDRLPRMRAGFAHVYNCIMDSSSLYTLRNTVKNSTAKSKIVSNGAISTMGANVLLQNDKIDGIVNVLLSGNGNSAAGAIGASDCYYTLGGVKQNITVLDKTNAGLVLDKASFLNALPYKQVALQEAETLEQTVLPYTGAGTVTMTATQWMQTSYTDEEGETPEATPEVKPESTPEVTPEATPEVTPEATPVPTPETTPEPTPEATPETGAQVHNFTEVKTASPFFTITGSLTSSKGTVAYEGLSLTTALKMESATKVAFVTETNKTLTLVANDDCTKAVLIDGTKYEFQKGKVTISLAAGAHTITKCDSNVNLYYIQVK